MAQHRNAAPTTTFVELPLIATLAIYARITTRDKLQTAHHSLEDLKAYAKALGFQREQVTVFCDEGMRAAAPLLGREGYTTLLSAIRDGRVNVLFLYAAGRIFSYATELQVNTFLHQCIEKGVFIVTPHAHYDLQDLSHISQFRRECVTAFQVIEEVAKLMQAIANSRHQKAGGQH